MAKSKKQYLSRHHIRPTSRNGKDEDNLVVLPFNFHAAWHFIFANMTISEVYCFIDTVMRPNQTWTRAQLKELMEKLKHERKR